MSKVLIIDDDKSIRFPGLYKFWSNQGIDTYTWLTTWPKNFFDILINNPNITHLSLDHDLGSDDVSRELGRLFHEYSEEDIRKAFNNIHVVVHSMNPQGAGNIANRLEPFCASVSVIPFSQMVGLK